MTKLGTALGKPLGTALGTNVARPSQVVSPPSLVVTAQLPAPTVQPSP